MKYLTYEELLALYVAMMRDRMHETYYGILDEGLLRSALARPLNAAHYEQADGIRQVAYLFQGLLMSHGFAQGNKRIAYLALEWFLERNALGALTASDDDIVHMCLAAEHEKWTVEQLDQWLREHVKPQSSG
jgi:death-on-curing protein